MALDLKEKLYLTFRALWHRNYRLYFFGQSISLTGTWIQQIAISWLVYSLTKSPLLMGVVTFAGSIPAFILSPFAGVIVDRVDKYKLLIILQILFLIESFILAVLTLAGIANIWTIIILIMLTGVTYSIDMPLRQALVVHLVDDIQDLNNAISLNSSCFNLARLIGPALAGVLIASVGEGICFLINSLSYIAVIWALLLMKVNSPPANKTIEVDVIKEMKEGFKYVSDSIPIKNVLLYLSIASFIGMSYSVLMPIFAKEILNGNAQTLGFLMSASGVGALLGALILAARKTSSGLGIWILNSSLLFSLGFIGLAFSNKLWSSLILLFIIGFAMVIAFAACNTLIQNIVDDDKRGRMMSIYTMAFIGTAPFGSLCEGAVANKIGVPYTFLLCGLLLLIATFGFWTQMKGFQTLAENDEEFAEAN